MNDLLCVFASIVFGGSVGFCIYIYLIDRQYPDAPGPSSISKPPDSSHRGSPEHQTAGPMPPMAPEPSGICQTPDPLSIADPVIESGPQSIQYPRDDPRVEVKPQSIRYPRRKP